MIFAVGGTPASADDRPRPQRTDPSDALLRRAAWPAVPSPGPLPSARFRGDRVTVVIGVPSREERGIRALLFAYRIVNLCTCSTASAKDESRGIGVTSAQSWPLTRSSLGASRATRDASREREAATAHEPM